MNLLICVLLFVAELGDFNELFHRAGYVSEFSFVPDQTLDFEDKVAELHKTLRYQLLPAKCYFLFYLSRRLGLLVPTVTKKVLFCKVNLF